MKSNSQGWHSLVSTTITNKTKKKKNMDWHLEQPSYVHCTQIFKLTSNLHVLQTGQKKPKIQIVIIFVFLTINETTVPSRVSAMQLNCQTLECDAAQDSVWRAPRPLHTQTQDLKLWEHDKMINIRPIILERKEFDT